MVTSGETGWYSDGDRDRYRWPKNKPATRASGRDLPEVLSSRDRMIEHLHRYFDVLQNGTPRYSGSLFEFFAARAKHLAKSLNVPTRFNECHILAAESLSISIPPRAALWLLEPDVIRDSALDECSELLRLQTKIKALDVAPESWTDDASPFSRVHERLKAVQIKDFGRVTRSKVLAALLPNVVPIRDSRVEWMLGLEKSERWWKEIYGVLRRDEGYVAKSLASLELTPLAAQTGLLRRLDVVLWMEYQAIHAAQGG